MTSEGKMVYDLVILGGGPAGASAAVYAARKKLSTVLITESFGGQSVTSPDIQNWIGTPSVSGYELAKMLEKHVKTHNDVVVRDGERAVSVEIASEKPLLFRIRSEVGGEYEARAVLLALGSHHKRLGVPGEREFDGRGVAYCSTCDAPLFSGRKVAVVGGGNSALEAVRDLLPYAEEIVLLHRRSDFRGDPVTLEQVRQAKNVQIKAPYSVKEILGVKEVERIKIVNLDTKAESELEMQGVFVEIGAEPNSAIVKELVKLNGRGEVMVDHRTQQTSCLGIWAAGDVSDVMYKQNNISAGDAVKAVLSIYDYLHKNS